MPRYRIGRLSGEHDEPNAEEFVLVERRPDMDYDEHENNYQSMIYSHQNSRQLRDDYIIEGYPEPYQRLRQRRYCCFCIPRSICIMLVLPLLAAIGISFIPSNYAYSSFLDEHDKAALIQDAIQLSYALFGILKVSANVFSNVYIALQHSVDTMIEEWNKPPICKFSKSDYNIDALSSELGIFGQDQAVDTLEAGLLTWDMDKQPIVMLLAGPAHVGKRTTVVRMTQTLLASQCRTYDSHVLTLYGQDYVGSDIGVVQATLFDQISNHVNRYNKGSVVIVEQVDKMDKYLLRTLIESFQSNSVWDWPPTVVVALLSERLGAAAIGQALQNPSTYSSLPLRIGRDLDDLLVRPISTERIDVIAPFYPLQKQHLAMILARYLEQEGENGVKEKRWSGYNVNYEAIERLVDQQRDWFIKRVSREHSEGSNIHILECAISGAKQVSPNSHFVKSIIAKLRKCTAISRPSLSFILIDSGEYSSLELLWCDTKTCEEKLDRCILVP